MNPANKLGLFFKIHNALSSNIATRSVQKGPPQFFVSTRRENLYEKALKECKRASEVMQEITKLYSQPTKNSEDHWLRRICGCRGDNFEIRVNNSGTFVCKTKSGEGGGSNEPTPLEDKCKNNKKKGGSDRCVCPPKKDSTKKNNNDKCKKIKDPCKRDGDKKNDKKKKENPCKKKNDTGKKKEDPCKKNNDANKKKKEDPCKKNNDAAKKKKEDPCKKNNDAAKKKEDPCKKNNDAAKKKKDDASKKNDDPCKKNDDASKKKEDPCKKFDSGKKKDDPNKKNDDPCKPGKPKGASSQSTRNKLCNEPKTTKFEKTEQSKNPLPIINDPCTKAEKITEKETFITPCVSVEEAPIAAQQAAEEALITAPQAEEIGKLDESCSENEESEPDIFDEVCLQDAEKLEAAEGYFGECYQNKQYYAFSKYGFYDVHTHLMPERTPQPSARDENQDDCD